MAEDLRQWEEKAESLERKVGQLESELRIAKGNVTALSAVIGLLTEKYPETVAGQYIRECVEFGLIGELMKKESSALKCLARLMDGETYERLVALCVENQETSEPEFEMPDTAAATEPAGTMKSGAAGRKAKAAKKAAEPEGAGAADAK